MEEQKKEQIMYLVLALIVSLLMMYVDSHY